jgi:hypothetical protein
MQLISRICHDVPAFLCNIYFFSMLQRHPSIDCFIHLRFGFFSSAFFSNEMAGNPQLHLAPLAPGSHTHHPSTSISLASEDHHNSFNPHPSRQRRSPSPFPRSPTSTHNPTNLFHHVSPRRRGNRLFAIPYGRR